jgi:hypothetical protein
MVYGEALREMMLVLIKKGDDPPARTVISPPSRRAWSMHMEHANGRAMPGHFLVAPLVPKTAALRHAA